MPPGFRFGADLFDDLGNLVDAFALGPFPCSPLRAIDGTEVARFIGPGIPDVNLVIGQIFDVRVPCQEPEQFMNDPSEEHLSSSSEWKTSCQIETELSAKNAASAGPRAVSPQSTVVENTPQ
ncbi:hypothetical protein SDC9_132190 [bioreactor metagenome]|uniref:Uncharacterized protein n=1 Tax=bioreactor metagenome TaxID=1076179 RepID=A0A645D842_9ZZZZ